MFDIFIYSIGYEARSRHAVQVTSSKHRVGIAFSGNQVFSFTENLAAAKARGDIIVSDECVFDEPVMLHEVLSSLLANKQAAAPTIGVDVSSMTGGMMAGVLHALIRAKARITLFYSPSKYSAPSGGGDSFVRFTPLPGCEGWTQYPERPQSVVLGLGYEADQAIGTVEYLDPSGVWAFIPHGLDPRFYRDVVSANRSLWPILNRAHTLEYRIVEPAALYADLRGLVEALSRRSRVTLVPVGPKLFTALCILIRSEIGDEVAVWRASSHGQAPIRDVSPEGPVIKYDAPTKIAATSEI